MVLSSFFGYIYKQFIEGWLWWGWRSASGAHSNVYIGVGGEGRADPEAI
jgi:hypothetical protein